MFARLKRAYRAPELPPQLRIIHGRVEQRLGATDHFVGERYGRLVQCADEWLRTLSHVAEELRMRAVKIDARDLARGIHRFQEASVNAAGIRAHREERQTLAAGSPGDASSDDQQVCHVTI